MNASAQGIFLYIYKAHTPIHDEQKEMSLALLHFVSRILLPYILYILRRVGCIDLYFSSFRIGNLWISRFKAYLLSSLYKGKKEEELCMFNFSRRRDVVIRKRHSTEEKEDKNKHEPSLWQLMPTFLCVAISFPTYITV